MQLTAIYLNNCFFFSTIIPPEGIANCPFMLAMEQEFLDSGFEILFSLL